jgi:hypothetical protein
VDRIFRLVISKGFRRGMRGGHPLWFVVAASAWMLNRARKNRDDLVYRTQLRPGEGLVITTGDPRASSKKSGA